MKRIILICTLVLIGLAEGGCSAAIHASYRHPRHRHSEVVIHVDRPSPRHRHQAKRYRKYLKNNHGPNRKHIYGVHPQRPVPPRRPRR